jgi:EAL domain-containing protein (putative c-di-GMP-specific phosphodiesterase class I)
MAERMHQAAELLKFKWTCHEQEYFVSVTMGMAIYPTHGCDLNILEINADTALFHAKEHARGKCVLFRDEMRNKILNTIHMSSLLRTALEQNQFSLAYQPIIELSTMTVSGVEALIRLNDTEGRPVSPMSFIPFAEQHGYINSISEWVIKTAAKQKHDWGQLGFSALTMSINLSGKCLTHNQIVQTLEHYMKVYHIRPEEFDLEITETAIIEDMDKSLKILDQLKEIGFSIALDDFGSGYSSLTYLNKLPIDTVKIDREFISQITEEADEVHLLSAIIDLSHRLGLRVLAEGVETESQLQYLIRQGCDLAQGYYFCRPLPAPEAEHFIVSRNIQLGTEIFIENTQ